jgi:flagellar protein FlbD
VIEVTRLNGKKFILNAEQIRLIEEVPDTTITLTGGEKYLVKEEAAEVVKRAVEYGRMIRTFTN